VESQTSEQPKTPPSTAAQTNVAEAEPAPAASTEPAASTQNADTTAPAADVTVTPDMIHRSPPIYDYYKLSNRIFIIYIFCFCWIALNCFSYFSYICRVQLLLCNLTLPYLALLCLAWNALFIYKCDYDHDRVYTACFSQFLYSLIKDENA
jgi:hypothetical protein